MAGIRFGEQDEDMNTDGSTDTEEQPPTPTPPTNSPDWKNGFDRLGTLRRHSSDRRIAGVCGGLARHFGIDATLVRVLFVLLIFFGGGGLLAYLVIWLVTPYDTSPADPWGNTLRAGAVVAVAVVALIWLVNGYVWNNSLFWMPMPLLILALIGLGIYALLARPRSSSRSVAPPPLTDDTEVLAHYPAQQPTASYAAPQYATQPPPVAPKPKPTGTLLFWPTLALIAISAGFLGIYDHSHTVNPGAYLALALAVIGVMTVVGAFVGRPGGLVPIGILTTLALIAASAMVAIFGVAGPGVSDTTIIPTTTDQLQTQYTKGTGVFHLDLSQIKDPEALRGKQINVNTRAGAIEVIVPPQIPIQLKASATGFGAIDVRSFEDFGRSESVLSRAGFRPSVAFESSEQIEPNQALVLNIQTNFGAINVFH